MIHQLDSTPVLGVSLRGVSLLRLDQISGPAPGNKYFKLQDYLAQARRLRVSRLVSFGGVWSNHLHALAAVGYQAGFETVGIVRGESGEQETAMILDARRWGMRIKYVSRSEYRQRHDSDYQQTVCAQMSPCLLIPEGGAAHAGARGCTAIAQMIQGGAVPPVKVVLPVGTGTTLAGVVAGLDHRYRVLGVSALKGAFDLEERVSQLVQTLSPVEEPAHWQILHDHHCGGFARTNAPLREFMLAFERLHKVQLDPVYTGKMLFAIHQLRGSGQWCEGTPVLAVHTGGLQGRRGFSWCIP